MRFVRTAIVAGLASTALAGAALAASDDHKLMLVALPDGSVQHIRYTGDVAPQIRVVSAPSPVALFDSAFGYGSPFAEMNRLSVAMEARAEAMMRQAAALQQRIPASGGKGIILTNAQGQPVGVMQYSYVSSNTDAAGCTRTIRYSSDGAASADQPRVIRTSSGSCGSDPGQLTPQARPSMATAAPVRSTRPAPKIVPVGVEQPQERFTPSRT